MSRRSFPSWTLSHRKSEYGPTEQPIPANVPGSVQTDYASAFGYKPYWFGENYKQFTWMEDEYWIYSTQLFFTCQSNEKAVMYFEGIDYAYRILANGNELYRGEGAFTPISIDMTAYSGTNVQLDVVILPIPKCVDRPVGKEQARKSCKPMFTYGWDWHPRLVPSGIWGESYLDIIPSGSVTGMECSYRVSDALDSVQIQAVCETYGSGNLTVSLADPTGATVYTKTVCFEDSETVTVDLDLDSPMLWYPIGYGEQPIYKLSVHGEDGTDTVTRKLGFRRSKLVRNPGDDTVGHPQTRNTSPITIEINGIRVFAKGSNWVPPETFHHTVDEKRYRELIDLARGANMNILRAWGGAYINKESFYDICDEYGIMVWQEFMLSCNLHPDEDGYLSVLEQEATSIIKRLRTHPCIAMWCGGNELFNSWSGMTEQSHALRLLDSICYKLDRFTPFNMTSPLYGMGHGYYNNIFDDQSAYLPELIDPSISATDEFLTVLTKAKLTAYTEFGCCGGASPEYVKEYIMNEEDYRDCSPENSVWVSHHAFNAWNPTSWLRKSEVEFYFGGYDSVDDLLEKTLIIQAVCYKTVFEEARKQAPHCSMVLNWDFNEPWPCAAGNSLINWPAKPKPALASVREALRPTIASLRAFKNRYLTGETLRAEIWLLNDSAETVSPTDIAIYLEADGKRNRVYTVSTSEVAPRSNSCFGEFAFTVSEDIPPVFKLIMNVKGHPEYDSEYTMFRR